MDHPEQLTALQLDLTDIFFSLDAARDFLVAGARRSWPRTSSLVPLRTLTCSQRHPRPR